MKKLLILALIFPFFTQATEIIPYNPPPTLWDKVVSCKWNIPCYFRQNFGTTITSISGSTQVSIFPTIYNTNNTNLNAGKFELSDWYATTSATQLTKIGTLTTGTWNATAITVLYGGTGSTTLSSNQLLIGNGTGNIGVVSGWGTSGQFLTSGGGTVAPTWTTGTVDQTANYNWTGTSLFKNLNASSTVANPMVLNGVSYSMPSANGNASSTLTNNASGALTWKDPPVQYLYLSSTALTTSATASTTLALITVPANTYITSNHSIEYNASFYNPGAGDCQFDMAFGNGVSTTSLAWNNSNNTHTQFTGTMYATSTQSERFQTVAENGGVIPSSAHDAATAYGAAPTFSLASQTYFAIRAKTPSGSGVCTLSGAKVQLNTF